MFQIMKEPFWIVEAIVIFLENSVDDTDIIIKNAENFGITREEMTQMFEPYKKYKKAVLQEILKVKEEKTILDKFQNKQIKDSTRNLLYYMVHYFADVKMPEQLPDLGKEEIRSGTEEFISEHIRNRLGIESEEEETFSGLEELMERISRPIGNRENREELGDSEKILYLDFYRNQFLIYHTLKEVLSRIVPILKRHFFIIKEEFNKEKEIIASYHTPELLKSGNFQIQIELEEEESIFLAPQIFAFNQYSIEFNQRGKKFLIGIYFLFLYQHKIEGKVTTDDLALKLLKALGDTTRLHIIQIIRRDGKAYLQQLSKELGLTPATVSHHINQLIEVELLQIVLDEKKSKIIYYELDEKTFQRLAKYLEQIAQKKGKESGNGE